MVRCEPGVAFGEQPWVRVETFPETRSGGVNVNQGAAYEYRPTLLVDGVDGVDLECDVEGRSFDDVAGPGPDREPRSAARLDKPVVHGQHDGKGVDDDRDPPNGVFPQVMQAGVEGEFLEPCVGHVSHSPPSALNHDPDARNDVRQTGRDQASAPRPRGIALGAPQQMKPRGSFLRWLLANPPSVTFSGLQREHIPVVNGHGPCASSDGARGTYG